MAHLRGIVKRRTRPPGIARMVQRHRDPDTSTYSGRVSAKLRELRLSKAWSVEETCDYLAQQGVPVELATYRSYERGKAHNGADVPLSLIPVIAKVFGYSTAHGWLPPA